LGIECDQLKAQVKDLEEVNTSLKGEIERYVRNVFLFI